MTVMIRFDAFIFSATGSKMALLYSVVSRGTTVLAKYASCSGNFQEITEHLLSKLGTGDSKMTYTQAK